jgi:hypothetical protein
MSAYLADQNHIEYLASGIDIGRNNLRAYASKWIEEGEDIDALGQMLYDENQRSVNYRYKDSEESPAFASMGRRYNYDPLQMLNSIACYEYQSCEHPEWEQSKAKNYCNHLRSHIIHLMTGGKKWGAPEPL